MNASVTGAWAKQRTRVSLNAPPAGSAAAAALARASAQKDGAETPAPEGGADAPAPDRRAKRKRAAAPPTKRGKTKAEAKEEKYAAPSLRLSDIGGAAPAMEKALELIAMPLCHPEVYLHTGVTPPRGVLLHGPPGCGKTMMAGALAGELGVPFLSISAPSIVSGTSGESEKALRETFEEAQSIAPCILFIDEIDAITPKRETAQREMERRIVAQLLTCLDSLAWEKGDGRPVMVMGATNRVDSIDPALRRAGRFDHEIAMGVPDEVLCQKLRLAGDFDFAYLAKRTPGFVGADLTSLTAAAGIIAVKRIFQTLQDSETVDAMQCDEALAASMQTDEASLSTAEPQPTAMSVGDVSELPSASEAEMTASAAMGDADAEATADVPPSPERESHAVPIPTFLATLPATVRETSIATFLQRFPDPLPSAVLEKLAITNQDFLDALGVVQPSSKREGFATVPDVTWDDIGALHQTREELSMAVVQPIRRPELFRALGVTASCGVLLWGPPGCGKTLLAKAVANESRANFISVKGPELLNKYVGESEKAVRQVFARARASSPCVIFFDELDALVPRRDDTLTYVIAATNRPDMIDPAMCRPGRLDKLLYVDLPSSDERLDILRTLTKSSPLAPQDEDAARRAVQLDVIAKDPRADGYSGADLAALVREAAVTALREKIVSPLHYGDQDAPIGRVYLYQHHFLQALDRVQPSVSDEQRVKYELLRGQLATGATRPSRSST